MIKRLIIIIFIICSVSSFGQNNCDSVSKVIIKNYENYSNDKFEKLRKKKNLDTETMFNVAEFLRYKGNAIYKNWYINYIDYTNAEFNGCNKNKVNSACILFKMTKAYYYTGNLKYAETYLNKAFAAKCSDKCLEYYSDLIKQAQNK